MLLVCMTHILNAQWASGLSINPYQGNNNPTIKNNNPDFIFEHTGNNTGEASIGWRDSGGDEAFLSYDFLSNEFFLGTNTTSPDASAMTLNLDGIMELRGSGNRGIRFMDDGANGGVMDGRIRHNNKDLLIQNNIESIFMFAEDGIRFFTSSDQKAMINNAGSLLLGTSIAKQKLTVEDGRIAVETLEIPIPPFINGVPSDILNNTGFDMYEGNTKVGGLNYNSGLTAFLPFGGNLLTLDNDNGGTTVISTDGGSITLRESGKVGINDSSPSFDLDVNGDGNFTGELMAASDIKLKRDIVAIAGATETINQLNPVTYEFRSDEFPDLKLSEGQRWGLIAQEVEAVLPDLVSENGSAVHKNGEEMTSNH